ncbi:MAG: isocitrate dehydrogenase [Nitrospinaceae bacterium]|jgi:isocitrate dehydrogenase (NAD+)|nr:isocitrate dehydrogenase [Nitrospinaceae bacterium]MBT3433929.1 isocitrate dehydrogenase [Nitrospinaceae bacterium]MBT4093992.1 isocitrate dehydrogenase [Nitrospinaceae bacterium]MBT4430284.1 isocitrate dehydrogenase [Nitrospinaceae bacterium]MBT5366635.1 isocitrate dehydrogenase [Nitrospinaceae bacterium]
MNDVRNITELLGDGIADELRDSVHAVAGALPGEYHFETVDLSYENRKKGGRTLYDEAVNSMLQTSIGLKYPTATIEESPNAILRKLLKFSVIHRPVTTIPGIKTNFSGKIDLDIVRVATGGTYDDPGQMIGDYAAASLRIVDRKTCEQAAHYAFSIAMRERKSLTSSSKYTIQRVTDGLFEDIVDEVAGEFQFSGQIVHNRELFDALLAKLVMKPEQFQVVLVLNEYGDFLSDLASGLVGSLGLGASVSLSFDEKNRVSVGMFDASHGTAPDIAGQDKANPTAILLAFSLLLRHIGDTKAANALQDGLFDCMGKGETTGDLGGPHGTTSFTKILIEHVQQNLTAS